jgi:hypothetical protein
MIYLYIKTHNITGLKYLGKTTRQDYHAYPGSGLYWRKHLDKHGFNYSTEILKECNTHDELKYWGKYYSKLWDIVKSNDWANLTSEQGDGGSLSGDLSRRKGKPHSQESRLKISQSNLGKKRAEETRKKMSLAQTGHPYRGITEEGRRQLSNKHKGKFVSIETRNKRSISLLGKSKSPEHTAKIREIAKTRCKPLVTPEGVFESRNAAAIHYGVRPESIGSRIKRDPHKYYYIHEGQIND